MFQENELDIFTQCNMKTVNYLDVTVNLENSTYRPYQTENNQNIYTLNLTCHHLPSSNFNSIESRLSSLFSSEEIFRDSVTPYQDALGKSGYKHELKYKANINTANNKKTTKNESLTHRTAKT